MSSHPRIVIIGGGFGGLYAAQHLKNTPAKITLLDRRNFHLFQPLLYQVATGGLSPANIAAPLRAILKRHKNTQVLLAEVTDIHPQQRRVDCADGTQIPYDHLIIATGASHNYFGQDHWSAHAPGLKTLEDATEIRRKVLLAFETAERESDPVKRQAWLRFVVVGGGPTGVELAGALAEIAHQTLKGNFRQSNPAEAEVLLVEAMDRILSPYTPELSEQARLDLADMGVTVHLNTRVTDIQADQIRLQQGDRETIVATHTVLWGAGVQASPLGQILHKATGVELDRAGRVKVAANLSIPNYPEIYVIGDLAHFAHHSEQPLPGVAPVAMQQGKFIAQRLKAIIQQRPAPEHFQYVNKGNMATIGRSRAVAEVGPFKFTGSLAWLMWLFIHVVFLVEFENRIQVLLQWAWNYLTRNRSARLITGEKSAIMPVISKTN